MREEEGFERTAGGSWRGRPAGSDEAPRAPLRQTRADWRDRA